MVLGDKAITAQLTKNDFQRVLFEQERIKTELKIGNIAQFDLFKSVSRHKLRHTFRLFYDAQTEGCYVKRRFQYLYR